MNAQTASHAYSHNPVMLQEVLEHLIPKANAIYVDATFGRGGYTKALLDAAPCKVLGIDRDETAIQAGQHLAKAYPGRLTLAHARFSELANVIAQEKLPPVQGVVFDLGVSSPQLDDGDRGFSFQQDGPLDMGMGLHTQTAADVVNGLEADQLADILWHYGGERKSRRLAKAIVEDRQQTPFKTTGQLAALVRRIVKRDASGIDPATRTFQALRIYVNNELEELWQGLCASEVVLEPEGVLVVLSFHSGEDGLVKDFFSILSGRKPVTGLPPSQTDLPPTFVCPNRKPLLPSQQESQENPRARSARLRWGTRTHASPWAERIRA